MTKQEILRILMHNRNLTTFDEIRAFKSALNELKNLQVDGDYVRELLGVFTDKMGTIDPMRELEEYIVYKTVTATAIEGLTKATPAMFVEAKGWLETLYIVLFTRETNFPYFKTTYNNLPDDAKNRIQVVFAHLMELKIDDRIENSIKNGINFILEDK